MTQQQHILDVVVRSVKTALAAYAAFLVAGGFNVLHVSTTIQVQIAAIAAAATALLNIGIKVHQAISAQDGSTPVETTPIVVSPVATPSEETVPAPDQIPTATADQPPQQQ